MKHRRFWQVAMMLVMVLGLAFASCEMDGGSGNGGTSNGGGDTNAGGTGPGDNQQVPPDINGVSLPTMVWIEPGTFTMGQNEGLPILATPATERQVTLTRGFYMGIHEVTQELYYAVMGANPGAFNNPTVGDEWGRLPVGNITWYHAIAFANRLSLLLGLEPVYSVEGVSNTDPDAWLHSAVPSVFSMAWSEANVNWNANGFRLPTEAEWEFAARAGTTTQWSFGDTYDNIDDYAWTNRNSDFMPHLVGTKRPNAWGLYDMHGNMEEWVWDRFEDHDATAVVDPKGAVDGLVRLTRGGSFLSSPAGVISATRNNLLPVNLWHPVIGFRIARN